MQRKDLVKVIKEQMEEHGLEMKGFAGELADRLEEEFGLLDEDAGESEDDED